MKFGLRFLKVVVASLILFDVRNMIFYFDGFEHAVGDGSCAAIIEHILCRHDDNGQVVIPAPKKVWRNPSEAAVTVSRASSYDGIPDPS
jgi:hypothetical protein